MPRDKWNCYFSRTWSAGRWWSINLWPALQLDWIVANKSFHVEVRWLLWEFKLNTFWRW
jgi:hypothetical protein